MSGHIDQPSAFHRFCFTFEVFKRLVTLYFETSLCSALFYEQTLPLWKTCTFMQKKINTHFLQVYWQHGLWPKEGWAIVVGINRQYLGSFTPVLVFWRFCWPVRWSDGSETWLIWLWQVTISTIYWRLTLANYLVINTKEVKRSYGPLRFAGCDVSENLLLEIYVVVYQSLTLMHCDQAK